MSDRDIARSRLLTRRALVLGGLQLGLASTLASRMYYLQVVESDKYRVLAEDNRVSLRLIAPERGLLLDHAGVTLAANEQNFQLLMISEQVPDVDHSLDLVKTIIGLDDSERKRIVRDIERKRAFVPVIVRENLTWDEVSAIELNTPDLPGLSVEVGHLRSYPLGEAAAHLIGYVGAPAEADMDGDPLLSLPGFKIGKAGIEKYQEDALQGTPGESQMEVNAYGRMIRELSREPGEAGSTVRLTIDAGLQKYAHDRLSEETSAAAVVMDVHTGAVYALASFPGFDPNLFSKGIPTDVWEELLNDPKVPLTNKASAGQYPPGSTFKMVTLLAGLESGAIGIDHQVTCTGSMTLGDHEFHCYKQGGHGTLGLTDALAQSCDVFFYDVGHRTGIDAIAAMAHRLGLGARLDLDLPGERPGLIPTRAWKLANEGEAWQQGETLINAIGQGYIKATPLQLAVMTARLASGLAVQPHLTHQVDGQPPERTEWPEIRFNPRNVEAVLGGMAAVTEYGTGAHCQIPDPAMKMAGKSGSAQVRRMTSYEREHHIHSNSLPWKERDHALFVGFAPIDAPRYACAVIVEHGNHGADAAGPVVRDLLWEAQKRDLARVSVAADERNGRG
jgi:penicillin-binding protein 2